MGQRFYILVRDVSDTARFGEMLGKRLWLDGLGRVEVSESGQRLVRTIFDHAMFEPARLDFIGGAICEPPLTQQRGTPLVLSTGGWLDTKTAMPDLTAAEEATYAKYVDEAKLKAEPEATAARERWRVGRLGSAVGRLKDQGVPAGHAEERAARMLSAALGGTLLGDFELTLEDGREITVGQALSEPDRYNGLLTLDPLEPQYQNGKVVGKLYLTGAAPTLHSFAHGGQTYWLRRQPRRLYLQKGRKAELANEVLKLLADEPDVYCHGGALVQVAERRLRRLRKPALMYLVGCRAALYIKTDTGQDVPADLPPDVADMVLALVEG